MDSSNTFASPRVLKPVYLSQLDDIFTYPDLLSRATWSQRLAPSYPAIEQPLILTQKSFTKALTFYVAYDIDLECVGTYRHATPPSGYSKWNKFLRYFRSIDKEKLSAAGRKYVDELRAALSRREPWPGVYNWTEAQITQPNVDTVHMIFKRSPKDGLEIASAYKQAISSPPRPQPVSIVGQYARPPPPPPHSSRMYPNAIKKPKAKFDFYDLYVGRITLPGIFTSESNVEAELTERWLKKEERR